MDMKFLNQLEFYYIKYFNWLKLAKDYLKFGNQFKNQINEDFGIYYKLQNKEIVYNNPEVEIQFLMYNIACIYYAKGKLFFFE